MATRQICVFCGSKAGTSPAHAAAARSLGKLLADRGVGVVYGGGDIGLMGIVADAAIAAGGEVTGIIPEFMLEHEVGHPALTRLDVVDSMHERKAAMASLADGFIALPGGLGTLEELFEIWTWSQLQLHVKPVGLLNVDGFYDQLIAFVQHTVDEGFVKERTRDLLLVDDDAPRLLDAISRQIDQAIAQDDDDGLAADLSMALPLAPPIEPVLARSVPDLDAVPRDDVTWEPKLDGFRCIVLRDGDDLELQGRSGRSLLRWFPEIPGPLRAALPGRIVLDGELVLPVDGRLDLDALNARIHPAATRIARLADELPARFVAFDVLAIGDRSLLDQPWRQRRTSLEQVVGTGGTALQRCPTSTERAAADGWFAQPVGGDLDGVVAKALDDPYRPGTRSWWKVKHRQTVDLVVAGYRLHRDGEGIGTLLLGLHDDDQTLHHVGATRSLAADVRRSLADELLPLVLADDDPHPWRGEPAGRVPGRPSRWRSGDAPDWIAVRPERVAECEVEGLQGGRLRSSARLLRWRPDRTPDSCGYDQLPAAHGTGVDGLTW